MSNELIATMILSAITSASIPSVIVGLLVWRIKRNIEKSESKREEKEAAKEESQLLLLKSVFASISLGEANATALQNGKCNGETKEALAYATEIKHEYRNFLDAQATKRIA